MTEQEMREIYELLLELTKHGRLTWRADGDYSFSTSFSRSSVSLTSSIINDNAYIAMLDIHNDEGVVIATATNDPDLVVDVPSLFVYLIDPTELLKLVRESVYKYSSTSQNVLHELRELSAHRPAA